MKKTERTAPRRGRVLIGLGLALLTAAAALTGYNLWLQARAAQSAAAALTQLETRIPGFPAEAAEAAASPAAPAEAAAEAAGTPSAETVIPDYQLNPAMEMPVETVDGVGYIGVLDIPALGLSLPVASEWDSAVSQLAPCRYSGSAYLGNLVIAGHNYRSHFGPLDQLAEGDAVIFTDTDGNRFAYTVAELEVLGPGDVEAMTGSDWALTLFTCTVGGQSRLAIRCDATE